MGTMSAKLDNTGHGDNGSVLMHPTLVEERTARLCHEVRTPLSAILALSEALLEGDYGPVNEQQRSALRVLQEGALHLLDVVEDVMLTALAGTGRHGSDRAICDLAAAARSGLRIFLPALTQKSQYFVWTTRESGFDVQADQRAMRQVIMNLLSNALKFTPQGGTIGIEQSARAGQVRLCVWDTGPGLSPEEIASLTSKHRADPLDTFKFRGRNGAGLGLLIVKEIVGLCGGTLEITSSQGHGSRFVVVLPMVAAQRSFAETADSGRHLVILTQARPATIPESLIRAACQAGLAVTMTNSADWAIQTLRERRSMLLVIDDPREPAEVGQVAARIAAVRGAPSPVFVLSDAALATSREFPDGTHILPPTASPRELVERILESGNARDERGGMIRQSPLRVLLVDDNHATATVIGRYLSARAIRVTRAADGAAALAYAQREGYDVVVLDLLLPDMNGLELLHRLGEIMREHPPRVIVLSALLEQGLAERCFQAGAHEYIQKPAHLRTIRQRIEQAAVRTIASRAADDLPHVRV